MHRILLKCSGWTVLSRTAVVFVLLCAGYSSAFAAQAPFRVFVTNEGSNDVTVIDGLTQSVVSTLPVGKRPRGIVVTPDHQYLLVALSGVPPKSPASNEKEDILRDKSADGIGVIEIKSGRIKQIIRGISDPEQLSIDKKGFRIFIASEDIGKAIVVDLRSNLQIANFDVGGEPEGVAVNRQNSLLCVTSEENDLVSLIDLRKNILVKQIKVGKRPRDAVFFFFWKYLYVPGESDHTLTIVDVDLAKVIKTIDIPGQGAMPKGVALSGDGGRLYISTGRGGQVVAYDTRTWSVLGALSVGSRPWGIALSPDSNYLYTANGPSNDVTVIGTQRWSIVATIAVGNKPWGVTVDGK